MKKIYLLFVMLTLALGVFAQSKGKNAMTLRLVDIKVTDGTLVNIAKEQEAKGNCIEADLAIHDCINGYQVENSAKRTQNKETDYDKAAFHAVFPFFLYKAFHSAQAAMTLPNVLPKVSITASMPMVCNPLMICSLPPTSMPRMNSSAQINTVMTV